MPEERWIESREGWQIYESCSVFYMFWIPLFRWNKKYYAKRWSDDCVVELSHDFVRNHESLDVFHQKEENVCLYCGRMLEQEYAFCPYCGTKL